MQSAKNKVSIYASWYYMKKLCIDKKKSNIMVIERKSQLQSLNIDDFTISVDSEEPLLARKAQYFVNHFLLGKPNILDYG